MEEMNLEELNSEFVELKKEVEKLKEKLALEKEAEEKNNQEIERLDVLYNDAKSKSELAKSRYENLVMQLDSTSFSEEIKNMMSQEVQKAKEEMVSLEKKENDLNQELEAMKGNGKASSIQQDIEKAEERMNILLLSFGADPRINSALQNEIEIDYADEIEKKEEEAKKLYELKNNITIDEKINSQLADLKELQALHISLMEEYNSERSKKPQNVKDIKESTKKLAELSKKLEDNEKQIKSNKTAIKRRIRNLGLKGGKILDSDIDKMLEMQENGEELTVSELEKQIVSRENEKNSLITDKDNIILALEKQKDVLSGKEDDQELSDLEEKIKEEDVEIGKESAIIDNLKKRNKEIENEILDLEEDDGELSEEEKSELEELKAKIEYEEAKKDFEEYKSIVYGAAKAQGANTPDEVISNLQDELENEKLELNDFEEQLDKYLEELQKDYILEETYPDFFASDFTKNEKFQNYKKAELELRKAMNEILQNPIEENIKKFELCKLKYNNKFKELQNELKNYSVINTGNGPEAHAIHSLLIKHLSNLRADGIIEDEAYDLGSIENRLNLVEHFSSRKDMEKIEKLRYSTDELMKRFNKILNHEQINEFEVDDIIKEQAKNIDELPKKSKNILSGERTIEISENQSLFRRIVSKIYFRNMPEAVSYFDEYGYYDNDKKIKKSMEENKEELKQQKEKLLYLREKIEVSKQEVTTLDDKRRKMDELYKNVDQLIKKREKNAETQEEINKLKEEIESMPEKIADPTEIRKAQGRINELENKGKKKTSLISKIKENEEKIEEAEKRRKAREKQNELHMKKINILKLVKEKIIHIKNSRTFTDVRKGPVARDLADAYKEKAINDAKITQKPEPDDER